MKEKQQFAELNTEFSVNPHERGLISKYIKSKEEALRQGERAEVLKQAIIERGDVLAEKYMSFVEDELPHHSNYFHPRRKHASQIEGPKKHTEIRQGIWAAKDGSKQRTVVYVKETRGNRILAESVKVSNPDPSDNRYISLDLITKRMEMRDLHSMQTLINGEPHIYPLYDEKDPQNFSDLLDTFTDELNFLKKAKFIN